MSTVIIWERYRGDWCNLALCDSIWGVALYGIVFMAYDMYYKACDICSCMLRNSCEDNAVVRAHVYEKSSPI